MNKTPHRARYFAIFIAVPLAIVMSGCSMIDEAAHKMRSVSFETAAAATDEWKGTAAWLPSDATDIEIRESTVNATAVILATSDATLDPELCAVVTRQSAPPTNWRAPPMSTRQPKYSRVGHGRSRPPRMGGSAGLRTTPTKRNSRRHRSAR